MVNPTKTIKLVMQRRRKDKSTKWERVSSYELTPDCEQHAAKEMAALQQKHADYNYTLSVKVI
tara:strand:- start:465 stop:653 length:189 start_codon:yes stop_codon:yes gene_type:complete